VWPNASSFTHLCEALHEWGGYRSDTGLSKKRSRTWLMPAIEKTANYDSLGAYGKSSMRFVSHHRVELKLGGGGKVVDRKVHL
jgi:hypothetical protein